jgi:hypothetical protein
VRHRYEAPRRFGEPAVKQGADLTDATAKVVGFVGRSARHHELGPIALAMLTRDVTVAAELQADGMPAGQEVILDPEVSLYVRPNLRCVLQDGQVNGQVIDP